MKKWLDKKGNCILNPGDIACRVYGEDEEHFSFVRQVLHDVFSEGLRVLYIQDSRQKDALISFLKEEETDFSREVSEGRIISPAGFSRCNGDIPGKEEIVRLLEHETAEAKKSGYHSLIIIADSKCLLGESPSEEEFLELKSSLDKFIEKTDCIFILSVNRNKNSTPSLLHIIEATEKIIIDDNLQKNPCYIPPKVVSKKNRPSARIDFMLKNILVYNENEKDLRNKIHLLEERKREIDHLLPELRRLKEIVNNSPAMAILWEPSEGWPVIFVSQNISNFGYNPSDFYTGKMVFSDIIHPDDLKRVSEEVERYIGEGRIEYNQEYRIVTASGEVRWVDDRTIVHRDNTGRAYMYEGVIMDITGSKHLEEELQLSNEKYSTIFAMNPDAIILSRIDDGTILEVNEGFVELTGVPGKSLPGKRIFDISFYRHPEDREAYIAKLLEKGSVVSYDIELSGEGGRTIYAEMSGSLVEIGEDRCALTIIHDVTERRKYEKKLKISSEKFKNTFNSIQDILYIVDKEFRIVNINRAFLELIGLERSRVVGKKCYEIVQGISQPCENCPEKKVFETGKPFREEMSINVPEKGLRCYDMLGSPIFNIEGRLILAVLSGRDITEMKEYGSAIEEANRKLNLLSQITRHDILNSLTISIGYINLLNEEPGPGPGPVSGEYFSRLSDSIDTIKRQIEFTRDYQDMGVSPPEWQKITPHIGICRYQGGGPPEGAEFIADIREIEIFADLMFEKALYNIITNAYKHAEGMKTLRIYEREEDGDLRIIFEDDGPGIAEDKKKGIFKPGYGREHGYGLFLVREILGITGMEISETGEPGKGARFEILVPAGKWRLAG